MSRIFRSKNQRYQILGGYILRIEFSQERWEIGMQLNRLLPKSFVFSGGKNPPLSAIAQILSKYAAICALLLLF
jgi:hypothetical protein